MRLDRFRATVGLSVIMLAAAAISPWALPNPAMAQDRPPNPRLSNVIPRSAEVDIHAKITNINPSTREVTLQGRSGKSVTAVAGPNVRLEMLKVGDTVNAQYFSSVAFQISKSQPGNAAPQNENQMAQIIAQPATAPGGVAVRLTRLQGLVVGLDLAANEVDMVNPSGGGVYTIEVTDPARQALLSQLKIGDTVTAVVSQTLLVSVEPARRSWF